MAGRVAAVPLPACCCCCRQGGPAAAWAAAAAAAARRACRVAVAVMAAHWAGQAMPSQWRALLHPSQTDRQAAGRLQASRCRLLAAAGTAGALREGRWAQVAEGTLCLSRDNVVQCHAAFALAACKSTCHACWLACGGGRRRAKVHREGHWPAGRAPRHWSAEEGRYPEGVWVVEAVWRLWKAWRQRGQEATGWRQHRPWRRWRRRRRLLLKGRRPHVAGRCWSFERQLDQQWGSP